MRVVKKPREVPLFKSARWDDFAAYIAEAGKKLLAAPSNADVNDLWIQFRDALKAGTKMFIEHKRHKAKIGLPYITPTLRKLMRKRDRLFDKVKKIRRQISMHRKAVSLKADFSNLKSKVQTETRRAYWSYIATIILPEAESPPEPGQDPKPSRPKKSFWSFIRL